MTRGFEFRETAIPGLIEIAPFSADDIRGNFTKDYSREAFEARGIRHELEEVFYTTSRKGVIRGMHFQRERQQAKLVRCVCGHVWDAVVDLRKGSPAFRQCLAFDLLGGGFEILVPEGCAHGYLVLEDSIVSYKCGEKFHGEYDDGILWDDPGLGIPWPLEKVGGRERVIVSEKDKGLQGFLEFMEKYGGF